MTGFYQHSETVLNAIRDRKYKNYFTMLFMCHQNNDNCYSHNNQNYFKTS